MIRESPRLREEVLAMEGGLLLLENFARKLNRNAAFVRAELAANRIIGVQPENGGDTFLPAWQVHRGCLLSGLDEVVPVLHSKHMGPLSIMIFFLFGNLELCGATPLDLLRHGKIKAVLAAASREGEMGC